MRTLGKSFVVVTSVIVLFCSVILFANAVEINQNNVPIKTNTDIEINGNITDIKSNTTVGGGSVGVNTFGKFNVENGEVVNLHLIGSQTKLINLIYDSSPSQINGIVNSYMNGKIGGNVLFANPNGFVIGADGVFNVGSLTLVTPTQQSMESFINDIGTETPSFNEAQLNKLISFSFNGDNYLVCGDTVNPIKLEKSLIEISGKINSANGIDIISGGNVEIKEGAQLNANLDFNYNEDDTFAGFSKKTGVTPNLTSSSKTFAMNDGNGIIIVSSNDGEKSDYLSAFVNLKGSVDANGSNIIVKSEAGKTNVSSNITVDGSVNANEIYLSSDGSILSTSAEIVANTLEVLANNEISLVNKGNLTISSITSKNSSVSLKSLEGSVNVTDFNSKTDANINAFGDVTLATTNIGTALDVVSKNFEVTTDLGVGEKVTITAKGDVSITSKENITFDKLNVDGTFDVVTKDLEITTGMNVGGKVTITSTGDVVVTPDVTLSDLEITSAKDVKFGNLKVSNLASITNDGKLTLGAGEFKDITINSDSADITSLTVTGTSNLTTTGALKLGTGEFKDVTINSASAEITNIKATGTSNLTTTGALTLGTGDFVGVIISSGSAEITSLKSTGDANLTTTGDLTVGTGDFAKVTMTSNNGSVGVSNLISSNNVVINSNKGKTTLETLNVDGTFDVVTKDLEITTGMNVGGKVTITSTGDVVVTPDVTLSDLEITSAKDVKFGNLKVSNLASITNDGKLTLGAGEFKDITINSGSADITSLKSKVEANLTTTGDLTVDTGEFAKVTMTSNNGSVEVSNLTSSNNVAINSENGKTTLGTLNVDGTFNVVAKDLEITTGMNVGGKVTITATGDINISPDVIFSDLEISANKLTYKNLTVNGTADITVTNDFTAKDVTINNLNNLSANNITIKNLTVNNDANIVAKGLFKTETATVSGNLAKLETNNAEIGSLTVTKDANIKATGKITANTIDVSGNLAKLETNNAEIGSLTVGKDANIKATGKITADTIDVTGNLTKLETNNAEIDRLTVVKDANIKATGKITADTIDVSGNLSKLETKNADIKNLTVDKDATIVSNGDVILGKTTIGNDFNASAKNLTFNDVTSVTGKTSLKATNKLTFVPNDVTFNNKLIIEKGTGIVDVNHLTVNGDADINSNGKTTINTANVTGNLTTDTNELVISDKLTVDKTANLGSKTSINVKEAEIYNLITKNANNVKIDNLKVDTDADIQAFGKVELGTIEVGNNLKADTNILLVNNSITVNGGKASLKATGYMKLPDLNLKDLTIEKGTGTVDIGNMNIVGKADINSNGKTTIKTATVQGDLTTDTNELEVVNKLTVTGGDTYLGSNILITLHDAELDNLKMNAHDAIIDNMVVHDYVDINANGDVSIKTANVEGLFTSKTANLEITDKLTADKDVNMTASNSIKIKDADIEKDLNTSAKTITIDEMNLKGKFNSEVDTLSVNTSNDLNIATIFGNSKAYTNKMYINSDKAILNALDNSKDINIYAKNIKMISNTNTATEDKPLNLKLAKNNNITLLSNGDIEIFTTGAVGNYRKIVTDYLDIKTDSYGVNVYSAIVNIYGDIRTANKHIIIDNTTWTPNLYVTLQLRSIISPHFLFVNRSPFIRTQSLNALRHGMNIYVNKTKDATSMNSWLVSSAEAQLKTSNTAKKFFDKTDSKLNVWSTLDSYISNNFSDEGSNMVIKTIKGEIMTPDNMDEFVNSNHNDIARPKRRLFRRNKTAETIQVSYLK